MLTIYMRIAVALFNDNVSPRLDIADSIMLYHISRGSIKKKVKSPLQCDLPGQVVNFMRQMGTSVILCGSCPGYFTRTLETTGYEVVCGQCGQPDAIIATYIENRKGMDGNE